MIGMLSSTAQVDTIENERHEHSITSKINLVDLAGSERQSQAKTSGDRLRVRVALQYPSELMASGCVKNFSSTTVSRRGWGNLVTTNFWATVSLCRSQVCWGNL